MFFYIFFCKIIKVNHFSYRFITLLYLISSFSLTRFFCLFHMHVFHMYIEPIDCILLSSFELKAVLLISSVKILCLSLLNLCCVFNIDLLLFMNSLLFFSYYLCQFISESKSSFITSSASSLIMISMLSLFECIRCSSSLSMEEIELFAIFN